MKKPLRTFLASTLLVVLAQQASAEAPPFFNNFGMQAPPPPPPIWNNTQAPIMWADCVPVPESVANKMVPTPMPAALPLPPLGPFFNSPPPAPIAFPMPPVAAASPVVAPVKCDDSAKNELLALKQHYDKAAAASKGKISSMEQSLADTQNQLADSRAIIETLTKEQSESADQVASFEQKTKQLEEKTASALSSSKEEITKLKAKLADFDSANKSLESKLATLEANSGAQARKLMVLGQSASELTALQSAYKARNDEVTVLKEKIKEFDNANKSLQSKLGALESNAGAQARKLTALGQSETELTALQSAYKARNDENAELKKKLAELSNVNKTLQSKVGSLEASAGSQARKLNALGQSATELGALQSAYKARNDENVELKKKLAELSNLNKTLQSKVGSLEASAGSQARKLTALGQSATELGALQSAYKARNDENVELKKKLAELSNVNKTLESKVGSLEASAGSQARKLNALGQSATELTALQAAYRMLNDGTAELKAKLAEAENKLATNAGAVESCNAEIIDLKSKLANIDAEKNKSLAALEASKSELNGLKESCKKLGAANDDLSKKLADATADGDKDGVLDHSDKCLNSPAGSEVNAQGCPNIDDADKDGVADAADMCPSTSAGSKVNEFGCGSTENITLEGVNFITGSANLTTESLPVINAAAATIKKNPSLKLEISGHTDNQGGSALNESLSQRRANSVMIELIKQGVEASRLVAKGYGDQKPIADNNTAEGRKSNRRVELKIRP